MKTGRNYIKTRGGDILLNNNFNNNTVKSTDLFQGYLDCSTNPNYPAGSKNMYWKVSVAGLIGGAAGTAVEIGDEVTCIVTNPGGTQAGVGVDFMIETGIADIGAPLTPVATRTNHPVIAINSVNANVSALDNAIGADNTPVSRTNNPTVANTTLQAKVQALDNAIGADLVPIVRTNNPTVSNTTAVAKIAALDAAIGVTPTSVNIIAAANSVNVNLSALDLALYNATSFNMLSASINGAGTNQGTGTVIATGIAVVGLADDTVGVVLPALAVGKSVTIYNITAAKNLKVYANGAETINGASTKKFTHATDVSEVICTRASSTDWLMTAIHGTIS